MNRRTFLAGSGAVLSAPLVGRLPVLPDSATDGNDTPGADDSVSFDPDRVQTELDVGSREGVTDPEDNQPHGVSVWNATSDTTSVEVRLVDAAADRTVLDLTSELAADAAIECSLLEPSTYRLRVRVPEMEAAETADVPRSWFDCNSSGTQVSILEGGRIESQMFSTLVACTDATVSGTPTD
ncbi:hypothetical protein HWV23_00525 [Natronomonas halophila]|uniref:hypothetical protein n=1 Tax=Natronomonas halophila TaxID=2747817 RepID=UPI0015B41B44|nr:hypothetical protein [Natronomonas halophila]QLD84251.1 hypothetical protein HWV23_00525 [Natronomonas halophila]